MSLDPHSHHRAIEDKPDDRLVGKGAGVFYHNGMSGKICTDMQPLSREARAGQSDIPRIAAGSLANLARSRISGKPVPLARAVDGDGRAGAMPTGGN